MAPIGPVSGSSFFLLSARAGSAGGSASDGGTFRLPESGLAEDILRLLDDNYRLTVTPLGTQPYVSAALAPPRFTLGLEPHRPS